MDKQDWLERYKDEIYEYNRDAPILNDKYDSYLKDYISVWRILDQVSQLASVYLMWLFAIRLRRVQVQVVVDKLEATAYIFKKLIFS